MYIRNKIDNNASIGSATLILFIASVLVVSVTASVLIQSSNNLEQQSLKTGKDTKEEVACGVGVYGVIGYCKSNTTITKMVLKLSPRPGTNGIDLSTTHVKISESLNSYLLDYGGNLTQLEDIGGNIFQSSPVWNNSTASKYNIIVVQDEDSSCIENDPIINTGDEVLLTLAINTIFNGTDGFSTRTDVFGSVVLEQGAKGVFRFRTPLTYKSTIINLLP